MTQSPKKQSNSVRIIAGEHRSRKLEFPSVDGLRPTADRIRETLFNWLQDSIRSEHCLDLFAGSGALGFESLSRGASRVDFIEKNAAAANSLRENIELLSLDRGRVYCTDALTWLDELSANETPYGLVFLDPPFGDGLLKQAIEKLDNSKSLREGCLIYIEQDEHSKLDDLPTNWIEVRAKKAGAVSYALYKIERNDV